MRCRDRSPVSPAVVGVAAGWSEVDARGMRAPCIGGGRSGASLFLALVLLSACTFGSDDPPGPPSDTSDAAADAGEEPPVLDRIVESWQNPSADVYLEDLPGAILVASENGETRSLAVGSSRLDPDEPMRVDDRFGAGSVTKPMVAAAILQLEDEGALKLTDTVEEWLPGMLPFGKAVTIEDLLDHRSGIFDVVNAEPDVPLDIDLTDQRLRRLLDHPPTGPPDKTTRYTNPGYWLLGKIIERATGHQLAHELDTRVFTPAGMTDTVLSADLRGEPRLVHGYNKHDDDITPGDYTGPWAAGGVVTTGGDLVRFLDALLHEDLVSDANLDEMTTSRGDLAAGAGYGLGVVLADSRCGELIGHDGEIAGYRTFAFYNPANGRTVVAFTNTSKNAADEALAYLTVSGLCYR
jgi:D-alanyl-D-alanine carboxypeptidase